MKGKRGRPSMEDELIRCLDRYIEAMGEVREAERNKDEAYAAYGRYINEVDSKRKFAASLLKAVLDCKNGVAMKQKRQKYTGQAAALPANVIPMEQRGG